MTVTDMTVTTVTLTVKANLKLENDAQVMLSFVIVDGNLNNWLFRTPTLSNTIFTFLTLIFT